MNRCRICNYTNEEGSDLLDRAPSRFVTVSFAQKQQDWICSVCDGVSHQNAYDLTHNDPLEEGEITIVTPED